jgi:NhaA family Na+:H+ antiporter
VVATLCALVLSNSPWGDTVEGFWETHGGFRIGSFDYERSLREWINDALMTLFFFVVALELKRELVFGELRRLRIAAFSIAAALGGMVVPAGIYLALRGSGLGQAGWGTVVATDTAFVIGALAVLGDRVPGSLRAFLLSLAIVDDIGAIGVIAVGYSGPVSWAALGLGLLAIVGLYTLARLGVRSFVPFMLVGLLLWAAVDASGVHATVAGVIIGLMTPARRWVSDQRLYAILGQVIAHPTQSEGVGATADRSTLQLAEVAARETLSPLERLELALHPWVAFLVLPLFALANAGLEFRFDDIDGGLVVAVIGAFVVGKPLGILGFCWLALRLRIAERPRGLDWGLLTGGGLLAGIGFTMALFIAQLAFGDEMLESAKFGIFLGSLLAAGAGLAVLSVASRGRTPGSTDTIGRTPEPFPAAAARSEARPID